MSKPAKRVNKTKEEIIDNQLAIQAAQKRRAFVKEKIFPILKEQNQDVAKTKMMIEVLVSIIGQSLENKKRDYTINDLKIIEMLKDDNDVGKNYRQILELLADQNVNEVMLMISDLPYVIDGLARIELGKKNINEIDLDALVI